MVNKVAFITGSARRIGGEIAKLLHQMGMNVVLHYHHSEQEAKELCVALNQVRKDSAMVLQGNLGDIKLFSSFMEEILNRWNRLDVLINNAAQFYKTDIGNVTEDNWNDLLNTNLKAPFFLSQSAAPYLAKQQGCIINIADIHGERPLRNYPVYSISKAGLVMMTKALAKELGSAIRVNAICPGPVIWPEKANCLSLEDKHKILDRTVLKSEGCPKQIAKTAWFLIAEAEYMTGQVITVDAGRSLFM